MLARRSAAEYCDIKSHCTLAEPAALQSVNAGDPQAAVGFGRGPRSLGLMSMEQRTP